MGLDTEVFTFGLPLLLKGLWHTVIYCAAAMVFGSVLAVILALCRVSRFTILHWPAIAFLEVFRNTPFLVQVFTIYFILPRLGIRFDATTAGILALSLFAGAFFSEALRGAIQSVPKGQMDAALAVGMSFSKGMRRIVFPQMLGYLLPSLTNQMIGVIKESAILSVISVPEMAMAAQFVLGVSFSPLETYIMVALLYWALISVVVALMTRVERKVVHAPLQRQQSTEARATTPGA